MARKSSERRELVSDPHSLFKIVRVTTVTQNVEEYARLVRRYRMALRRIYEAKQATSERLRAIAYEAYMHKPMPVRGTKLTAAEKRALAMIEPQGFIVDASPEDITLFMKAKRKLGKRAGR